MDQFNKTIDKLYHCSDSVEHKILVGYLKDIVTDNYVPIKHSYWKNKFGFIRCQNCGAWPFVINEEFVLTKYCHDCGAKMDQV